MGWTYTHKSSGQSVRDFFKQTFGENMVIVECAVVNMRTAYMACYNVKNPSEVFAIICLLGYAPKDYYNFGYKDMDETMGPNERSCPEKVLKALTPLVTTPENPRQWANEWRADCWNNLNKKKEQKKVNGKIEVGDIIEYKDIIHFRNGVDEKRFKVERVRPFRVKTVGEDGISGYGTYKPGKQEFNAFTVVAKAFKRPEGMLVFRFDAGKAEDVMLKAHNEGVAICSVEPLEVAEMRCKLLASCSLVSTLELA